ncbi:MAG: Lipopolysaccharide assembly protein domain [Deltaproteobacteria bacterium]|nr:Lipopolysaccharide assembly protein domain [Deltaproteobacteria bacterium]
MQPKMIGLLLLLAVLLVFALQNTHPVAIKFLLWETTASAVLTILISFCLGALTGWLIHYLKAGPSRKI